MPEVRTTLAIEPLTAEAFRPFGDVIEASEAARHFTINEGFAERYHDLARVDVSSQGGRVLISIFKARPRTLPMQLILLERHPLGSQAFMPLSHRAYLVVVAPATPNADTPDTAAIRCFRAEGNQGVNYAPGTWHHPLIALDAACDFLVVDRGGAPGEHNCDEYPMGARAGWIDHQPSTHERKEANRQATLEAREIARNGGPDAASVKAMIAAIDKDRD